MENKTVAQIVASDMRTAVIFKKYGIDFCCGGGKPVSEACNGIEVKEETIFNEIEMLDAEKAENDFDNMGLDVLSNHILETHHVYVKESLPIISEFANKVAKVHGDHNPENIEIAKLFHEVAIELQQHLIKEEGTLFPHIINLAIAHRNGGKIQTPFGSVQNPIRMMEHEHDIAGNIFKKIEKLSNNFSPPAHACNTYKALYYHLKEFQSDLHIHIHLENNILFPKAIELEKTNQTDH
ncbi:MAG: iron-sulfur cluster repair di-iron protein [Flavobacteriales bacterium]|nr:iron-sulfur cluster repair di-iron protein [Flavobacteriales bacterium]